MDNILLSKMLFNKAEASYSPNDYFSHGLTVSLLQDAAEMLVWAMVQKLNVTIGSKDGFVALVENIDKNHGGIDFKPQIFELNTARVGFKHYGNIPSVVDIPKYINNCQSFLRINAKRIGVDFDLVSSADSVLIPKIRDILKNSEQLLENDLVQEALIKSSIAFQELEEITYKKLNMASCSVDEIREFYKVWPQENWEAARDFTYKLGDFFENTLKHLSNSQLGYSPEYVYSIKSMCYRVHISEGGNILGVSNLGNVKERADSVRFINNFIIEASKRL